jgi:hypothetical protein
MLGRGTARRPARHPAAAEAERPGGNATKAANQLTTARPGFTAPRRDPHDPLTAEDRADLDVLIAAAEREPDSRAVAFGAISGLSHRRRYARIWGLYAVRRRIQSVAMHRDPAFEELNVSDSQRDRSPHRNPVNARISIRSA